VAAKKRNGHDPGAWRFLGPLERIARDPTATRELIESLIREYIARGEGPPDVLEMVRRHNVLPLHMDMGGCGALRPDGEIVEWTWDDPSGPAIDRDPTSRQATLFQGAVKYPSLRVLLPVRPAGAIECSGCKGTGRFILPDLEPSDSIICRCGGAGWLPEPEP
jgi:hypothetical protein